MFWGLIIGLMIGYLIGIFSVAIVTEDEQKRAYREGYINGYLDRERPKKL